MEGSCEGTSASGSKMSPLSSLQPIPDPLTATSTQSTPDIPINPSPKQPLPPHNQQLPIRFQDLLPEPPLPVVDPHSTSSSSSIIPHIFLHMFNSFSTQFNKFGIMCAYCHWPSHDLDSFLTVDELSQSHEPIVPNPAEGERHNYSLPWPWSNMSIWCLMTWKETGSALKSNTEVMQLVHDILQAPDFDVQDLSLFDASRHTSQLDAAQKSIPPEDLFSIDKWKRTTV